MAAGASQYRFGDLLALSRGSWIRQIRENVEAAGFPSYRRTDSWVLRLLAVGPLPIGRLGDSMGVTRQTARQLADGLVARGYATFEADPADARRTLVQLTPDGKRYARAVMKAQDDLNKTMRKRVTSEDLIAADRVLRAVFGSREARSRVDAIVSPPALSRLR